MYDKEKVMSLMESISDDIIKAVHPATDYFQELGVAHAGQYLTFLDNLAVNITGNFLSVSVRAANLTETQTNSLVEYFCENLLNYFQKRRENGIDAKN